MSEHHQITGPSRGEPLPEGKVGVRVRVPLSGCPRARWSRDLSARLANELVGQPAVGHLRLNEIVQGNQIVLEGVEKPEAAHLAQALRRAVDRTNADCGDDSQPTANVRQCDADAIARGIAAP